MGSLDWLKTLDVMRRPGFRIARIPLPLGGEFKLTETSHTFPCSDPWAIHFKATLARLVVDGMLTSKRVFETGVGGGANLILVSQAISQSVGVDTQAETLEVAQVNIKKTPYPEKFRLYRAHCLDWLEKAGTSDAIFDAGFFCLPQAPSHSRRLDSNDAFAADFRTQPWENRWGEYGLSLLAGTLTRFRKIVTPDGLAVVILSHRVPQVEREGMLAASGWRIQAVDTTTVLQDPIGTPLEYVLAYDDGQRFLESTTSGFNYISAQTAIDRVKAYDGINLPNVWHDLSVYTVTPS